MITVPSPEPTLPQQSALRRVFHPAGAPSDAEVVQVLRTIRRRVGRLLGRRSLEPEADGSDREDPVAEASPALAGILGASVQGRVAPGRPAGGAGAPARRGAAPGP